ncbi:MAG: RnfABCDGE type electron transport complex subunit B [Candidatus Omnitrophica bacterium]|nr:RnfABCDGE type electron transport complex subunit B [Candidatus Omnitrophota bacterium]
MSSLLINSVATLGLIGFIFALLLALLSKKLKVESDPKVDQVIEILPGLNCGACGFSGCRPYAEAAVKEKKLYNGCLPGGDMVNSRVSKVIGIDPALFSKNKIVVCRCQADKEQKKISTEYASIPTCRSAHITGGALDCVWGCLGFGDCINVCPVNALSLKDRKITVDFDKCIGCGQCLKVCPRNLFELIPYSKNLNTCYVACSSKDKASAVKKVCSFGCIGCTLCTKPENSPYFMQNNLSCLNYQKAPDLTALKAGKEKCPVKCILEINV